eukprot:4122148-Pyramimonas_sp.AAC.1
MAVHRAHTPSLLEVGRQYPSGWEIRWHCLKAGGWWEMRWARTSRCMNRTCVVHKPTHSSRQREFPVIRGRGVVRRNPSVD